MTEQRYTVRDEEVDLERRRLDMLAQARDPKTHEVLSRTGVGPGWRCWELGAGSGSVTAWLAEMVHPDGSVWSTDVDLQFHVDPPPGVKLQRHDVATEQTPAQAFDLIHARAVLQHIPERDQVVTKLWEALAPGGWLVLEDGNFMAFGEQTLPEPYATVHRFVAGGATTPWRDPNYGVRLPGLLRDLGATDIDIVGDMWAMRPGEPGGEWWFMALERAFPHLVEAGLVSAQDCAQALEQVRAPGFVMMSTLSIAVLGRKPAANINDKE